MLLAAAILFVVLPLCSSKPTVVTFKNVTFRGYSLYTEKFKRTIPSSNSLKDYLPTSEFDKIEFSEQNIPVLYENSLADLDSLDELVIEYCEVSEIKPGALKNVPGLRRLSLKGNRLEEINEGVFNNLDISMLDLSLNSITTIESDAFDNLPSILNINLADNRIGQWDKDWFHNDPHLLRISMQNNSISKLPKQAFQNLGGNRKYGLINLIFTDNKINVIEPEAFDGLHAIKYLWLDKNQLEEFGENLLNDIEVKDLRLDYNNITCFEGDLAKIIKADVTYLDVNPFDCQCLDKIKTWAEKNGKDVQFFFSEMDCISQRIEAKMLALEKRLKEIKNQENEIEIAEGRPHETPIK